MDDLTDRLERIEAKQDLVLSLLRRLLQSLADEGEVERPSVYLDGTEHDADGERQPGQSLG